MAEPTREERSVGTMTVVLTTLPDALAGERFVEQLVDESLIACGNIIPGLTSVFRWKGAVSKEPEALVLIKTTRARLEQVLARARELHPYEVPELVALPVEVVSESYLRWVQQETAEVNG